MLVHLVIFQEIYMLSPSEHPEVFINILSIKYSYSSEEVNKVVCSLSL